MAFAVQLAAFSNGSIGRNDNGRACHKGKPGHLHLPSARRGHVQYTRFFGLMYSTSSVSVYSWTGR